MIDYELKEKKESWIEKLERPEIRHACILIFVFIGFFLWPVHMRYPLLSKRLSFFTHINFFVLVSILFSMSLKQKYSKAEKWIIFIWLIALLPSIWTNRKDALGREVAFICNCWFPMFLLFYRMQKEKAAGYLQKFLWAFDAFIVVLMLIGIYEKYTDNAFFTNVIQTLNENGYKTIEYDKYVALGWTGSQFRFCSIWGHPLTNALLFNAFFIGNDIYYRSLNKKYPRFLFFGITLIGVLLCSSKTGIVVLGVYFLIMNWEHKIMYVLCGVSVAVMYALGLFSRIIERFTSGPLTTGRLGALKGYFGGNVMPLKFFSGYGHGTTYGEQLYSLRAAFEFPILMYSLDHGILVGIIIVFSIYGYVTWRMLRKRQWIPWIGFTLWYAQANTYNGMSLYNQDVFAIVCFFSMLMVNCVELFAQEKTGKRKS